MAAHTYDAILRVSADLFLNLFKAGPPRTFKVLCNALPNDVRVVDLRLEFSASGAEFVLKVVSDTEFTALLPSQRPLRVLDAPLVELVPLE